MSTANRRFERGGVSIFIVIFTSLLVTVVTASFAQIMLRAQQQASTNDLSQSAYDAAMAGVEDAKRVLVRLRECENTPGCNPNTIRDKLAGQTCQSLDGLGVRFNSDGEVQVGAPKLNQAYTCVSIDLETDSYDAETPDGIPIVIPLQATAGYDRVYIRWFTQVDLNTIRENNPDDSVSSKPVMPSFGPLTALPSESEWDIASPALMRAQLIQFKAGEGNIDSFNQAGSLNARTMFLYPNGDIPRSTLSFGLDARRSPAGATNQPVLASCNDDFDYDGFACEAVITLPDPVGINAGNRNEREAYLQLQTFYQSVTSYSVEMSDGVSMVPVKFDTVQPEVDSTGRASDLFRRVQARVSLRNNGVQYQFPDAALSIEGNLCKTFFVTDDANEYQASGTPNVDACEP